MKISVIGTGYVGLVTGTCFAERGNDVMCIDINEEKVAQMRGGKVPIYEPGLDDIFQRNIKEDRLQFSTDLQDAMDADVIFLALPTPQGGDGAADLSYIEGMADKLGPLLKKYTVIVDKSTVPVGTAEKVRTRIAKGTEVAFDVVSNPEFLREGQAVDDFMHPDRAVIGVSSDEAAKIMTKLYAPFVQRNPEGRIMIMDVPSAELTKYAANAFLATKISFMNGLTELCEKTGADITEVRRGIGSDARIGNQFLYAGPGFGGSCFPKDANALVYSGAEYGIDLGIIKATILINERQKHIIPNKISRYYNNNITGKTFALWGLAFKDNTDDVRESPALTIIDELTKQGANVVAFDPQAIENTRRIRSDNKKLTFAEDQYAALKSADALVIITNWSAFHAPDFAKIKTSLKAPVIFDGRNLYNPKDMQAEGFHYESIGRRVAA